MKQLLLFLIGTMLIGCSTTNAPRTNSNKAITSNNLLSSSLEKYRDYLAPDAEVLMADHYRTFEKLGETSYVLKVFNPDKVQKTHEIHYADANMENLAGSYKEWYDNGSLWKEGLYLNGRQEGAWKVYSFPNSNLREQQTYQSGLLHGIKTTFDTTGYKILEERYVQGVLHGNTIAYNTQGDTAIITQYISDEKVAEEVFDNDVFNRREKQLSLILPTRMECTHLKGEQRIACSEAKWLEAIYSKIKYPQSARIREIEGRVIIRFVINKKGKITDLTTLRGICDDIEAECYRVLKRTSAWYPGLVDKEAVDVTNIQPLLFKLN